jgi:general stress protein 26
MGNPQEIEALFWKALEGDRTLMLGLDGIEDGRAWPLTAHIDAERGPLWFFADKDDALVSGLAQGNRAIAAFAAKDLDLFASLRGTLQRSHDRLASDRLWNRRIAAGFAGGKSDPALVLLRLDLDAAELWHAGSRPLARVRITFAAPTPAKLAMR